MSLANQLARAFLPMARFMDWYLGLAAGKRGREIIRRYRRRYDRLV